MNVRERLLDLFDVYKHPFLFGFMLGNTVGVVTAVVIQSLGLK